jgi:hypothetical protein
MLTKQISYGRIGDFEFYPEDEERRKVSQLINKVFNRFEYNVGDTHIDRLIQKEKS